MDLNRFSLGLAAMLFAHSTVVAENWVTDYSTGASSARERDRAMFLFFTGSDWCGYCQALEREVLSTPEFASFAEANLVLVKIDFPHHRAVPADEAARNQALARKFGIHGFPTVIVLNSKGDIAGQTGYKPGGPAGFITEIRQFPGINWRASAPAASAGSGGATPGKANVAPAPLYNGAQVRPPKKFDRIQLNGIMGTKQRPMIMVNNQTLMAGESARLDVNNTRVKVTCKEIRAKSAILLIEGQSEPKEIFLDGN